MIASCSYQYSECLQGNEASEIIDSNGWPTTWCQRLKEPAGAVDFAQGVADEKANGKVYNLD